jgi:hypothetical protein
MMHTDLIYSADYWQGRWEQHQTGWDIGHPSPPITEYFKHINKDARILIPGCGNAWEGQHLLENGFTHVTLLDIAPAAVQGMKERMVDAPDQMIQQGDFFEHEGSYDYIVEQTFFCALHPSLRADYVEKAAGLLKPTGKLVGVLFDTVFDFDHPPFGGNKAEYEPLFSKHFDLLHLERCRNSIAPRQGRELFIQAAPTQARN